MTEAEYLENKLRGTGRTTNLIKNSPRKCAFIVLTQHLAVHFKRISIEIGRPDVLVIPYWQTYALKGKSDISDIVFDHYLSMRQDQWDEMYELREIMRQSYKGNTMNKLEKLKKDLLLIEDSIDPMVSWSKYEILVNEYAPGFKVGLKGFLKAKEEIERLIEAEENAMTPFQRAKEEYEKYGANGFANDYIAELEKCQPWIIIDNETGNKLSISHNSSKYIPIAFLTKEDALEYMYHINYGSKKFEIVQWEGSQ